MDVESNHIDQLIKGCCKMDQKSCYRLYNLFKNSLFSICLRYGKDRSVAEDWLQEAFISIFRNIKSYDPDKGSFYTWASRVVINTILMYKRKQKIKFFGEENILPMDVKVEPKIVSSIQYQDLIEKLKELPDGFRTVFNLYEIEGLSHKEISQKLNISLSTSKTQLMRAKLALRKKIEHEESMILSQHVSTKIGQSL